MPDIVQKLGFDASGASRNLTDLTKKMDAATASLAAFQTQAAKSGGLDTVEKKLDKGKKAVQGFTVSFKTLARIIGTQFVVRGLASVLGQFNEGIQSARELATAIEEIQTISGRETGSAELTSDIIELSDVIGKTSQDLAEAYYQTLSNQVVEVGEALNFTSQAAKLATITVSETKDAVNALSSVMNSYGFEAERAEHIAGTLFKTVELGRLRLSEIANVIGRVTPLTAAMGVSWEETAASIAVMTRQGVKADTAITQLRAVMTKIIRPTDEMRQIFHDWGVRDGREAVQTFGGLNGVLSKLADETGHSSEAMADLLRRVRTIVGQLSLMKDGGQALRDTMAEIAAASSELTTQWDEFTQSDAHRLTVEINEFKNSLTKVGIDSLPKLRAGMEGLNDFIESVTLGVRSLSGEFDTAGIHAEAMKEIAIKAGEEARNRAAQFDEEQRQRYDGLAEAAGKYYVGVQQEENKLAEIRDTGIAAATEAFKAQGKAVTDYYKDAAKQLGEFVDGIDDTIRDNAKEIAKLEQANSDSELQSELAKWDRVYQKRAVLEKALAAQKQKAAVAFGEIDVTDESRDRAIAENDIALDLAEQLRSLAESEKNVRAIEAAEDQIRGTRTNSINILKRHDELLNKNKGTLQDIATQTETNEKNLQALRAERDKIILSGALDAKNEERRNKAQAALDAVEQQMETIAAETGRHDAFLKSLGLDVGFGKLTDAMTDALNNSQKDWQAEVDRMNAAFAANVLHLKVAIDPAGATAAAADALGITQREGEGEAEFKRRVNEAAIKAAKELDSIQEDLNEKQGQLNTRLAAQNVLLNSAAEETKNRLNGVAQTSDIAANVANTVNKMTLGLTGAVDGAELFKSAMERTNGQAVDLHISMRDALKVLQAGATLTDEELVALQEKINLAHFNKQINEEQTKALRLALNELKSMNQEAKGINAALGATPEQGKEEAIRGLVDGLTKTKEAELDVQQATESTRRTIEAAKQLTGQHEAAIDRGTEAQNQQTQAAEATVNATSQIGQAAANQVSAVNSLAQAYANLAQQARAAAAAQGAAGGSATAYHGGPMARYFAAGGIVGRGQDKILTALSRGETVTNSRQSARFSSELNAINQGSQPVFREQGGPVTNVGDVNVTVNGGDSSQQTVREIGHALRREIQRGNIKLR
jgi:TP901 family phage tail tape measure protein